MSLPSQVNPIIGTRLMDLLSRVATSNEIATFGFSNNNSGVKIRLYDNNNPSLGGILGYTSSNYGFSFTRETGNVNVGINTSYASSAFTVVGDCTLSGTLTTSNLIVTGVSSIPITTTDGVTSNISIYNPTGTDSSGLKYKNITTNDTISSNRILMNIPLNGGSYLFTTSLSYSNLNPSFVVTPNTIILGLYRSNVDFNINTSIPFQSMNIPLSNINQTFYNSMSSYIEQTSSSNILLAVSGAGQIIQFKGSATLINIGGIGANDSSIIDQTLQIAPIRQTFVVPSTTNIFSFTTSGLYQISTSSNIEVYQNTRKLYYYSPTFNDYIASYTNSTNSTTFTITTKKNIPANDILNITVWPTTLGSSFSNSYLYQVINDTSYNTIGLNINSNNGYVGIGTFNAPQRLSVVGKSSFSSNVGIGTSNPSALLTVNDIWNDGTAPMVIQQSIVGQEFPPVGISNFSFTPDYTDMVSSIDIGREFSNLEYPPYAMTNYTTKFPNIDGDYIASSSSYDGTNVAWCAFDKNTTTYWNSESKYNITSPYSYIGQITTPVNEITYPGEWLQIKIPTPIKVTKYSIKIYSTTSSAPSQWNILDSSDGINWNLLDTRNGITWTAGATNQYGITNPTRYSSYYRLITSNLQGNAGYVSIGEWRLFTNTTFGQTNTYPKFKATIPYYTSINPYGIGQYQIWTNTIQDYSFSNQTLPSGLFNKTIGSTSNTVWASYSNIYTSGVDATSIPIIYVQFPDLLQLTSYSLTARGGNAQETPSKWTLYGSNTALTMAWQSLNSQTNITSWTAFETKTYTVTTSSAYNFYKLELLRNSSATATRMSLGELRFYGTKQTPEPRMVISTNGFVGIGTTNPQTVLDINGDLSVTGNLCTNLMRTGPNVNFHGSTTNRDNFLQWMQYVTSIDYRFALQTRNIASGTWWNTNNSITRYDSYTYTQIFTGEVLEYYGGVLLPDGRVVFVPHNSSTICIFNPMINNYEMISGIPAGTFKYVGGVLLPDGRVIFVPLNVNQIGIFNPTTNTYTTVPGSPGTTDVYAGGVLLPDGRVVFIPYSATNIGIFTISTNTFTTIPVALEGYYIGGVLLPDGRVVFVPHNTTNIGIFTPSTNTFTTITGAPGGTAYIGGVLLPDGRVVFVPYSATNIGIFTPSTNNFTTISIGFNGNFGGGVLLPDGRVVFVPNTTTNIGIFTPSTNNFTTIPIAYFGYSIGGVLLPDGRVVFVPNNSSIILIMTPSQVIRPPPLELCYHPCFNKL